MKISENKVLSKFLVASTKYNLGSQRVTVKSICRYTRAKAQVCDK